MYMRTHPGLVVSLRLSGSLSRKSLVSLMWEQPVLTMGTRKKSTNGDILSVGDDIKIQVAATATVCSHLQKVAIFLFQF